MRILLRTFFVFLMSMIWLPSGVQAQQQIIPAAEFLKQFNLPSGTGQVWEGEITFEREDSKRKNVDEGGPGHTNRVIDIHTINASAAVRFCGCGRFYITDVRRNWSEKWDRGHIDAYDETLCPKEDADGKSTPVPVSPGNEDSDMERGSGKLYEVKNDKEKEALKKAYKTKPDGVLVSMTPIPYQGKYKLNAFVELFIDKTANAESLRTEVCSQKRERCRIEKKTVPFTQKPQESRTGGEDDLFVRSETHPIPELLGFSVDIVLNEGQETIEDEKTVVDKKEEWPGDWNRKTVVTWKLRMKNYCNDVFDALYADLAWAEAYNDPTLRQRAIDREYTISEYKAAVENQAQQTYSANHPDSLSNTGIEMSVDTRIDENGKTICYIKGAEKAKQSLRERCLPDIIFDAVYAHERRHVLQCKRDPDMFKSGAINKRGVYETDAHMAGIRKYISWLEMNCPNDNRLSVAKDRLAALKANLTR